MKTYYFFIIFNLICFQLLAQSQTNGFIPVSHPVSPTAYQFLKYDEIPVSMYSGLPEISIPIYQIETDHIKIPVTLTYHGGGIRVAEEASWVGLGWDLQMGNIVQNINDKDDLDDSGLIQKILPDYYYYPYAFEFCKRYVLPYTWGPTPACFVASSGIDQIHPKSSNVIFTDYNFPLNGSYDNRNPNFFNSYYIGQPDHIDSEPDIFKANFFGHVLTFIKDFKTGEIKVLDKKGYKVSIVTLSDNSKGIKVIAPDGNIFEFNEKEESKTSFSYTFAHGNLSGGGLEETPINRIFQISKVTDIDGKVITFNWSKTGIINELPGYNQTYRKIFPNNPLNTEIIATAFDGIPFNFDDHIIGGYPLTENTPTVDNGFNYSNMKVTKSYLTSVTFPLGTISFNTSTRQDVSNDVKLYKVEIRNNNQSNIKTVDFSYSYFVGHDLGMGFQKETNNRTIYHGKSSIELSNRLKLDSIKFTGEPSYSFVYNDVQLPVKSSYAVDYWGFYNGKTTNNSLIPNPTSLNLANLSDNGNDRSANEYYGKAASLEKIIYPTKGERYFIYESNTFSNPSTPTITTGNGLRIKETGSTNIGNKFKVEKYFYEGGKLLTPMSLFINYNFTQAQETPGTYSTSVQSGETWQVNSGNFYNSTCLGSGNIVGYDKVTSQSSSYDNSTLGKTVNYYFNNFDLVDQVSNFPANMVLPARKDETKITNGLVYKTEIYKEGSNDPSQKIEYEYNPFAISEVFYGAKFSLKGYYCLKYYFSGWQYRELPQYYMGFFPIYSGDKCQLSKEIISDYTTSGPPIVKKTYYYYDSRYSNISEIETDRSDGNQDIQSFYYPYDPDSFGNIQQYHKKDGPNNTILWGYNSQYPVAEIIGSDYNTVSTIINNQSLLDSPSGDNALRNYLNTLRTSLPNALVTTYTYTPLIGITSQTDPKGMMSFYEYDYANRLKTIRDQNGNIIKSYDYHYKQ